ncbi:armadillo-type protein [Gorgonomyces haynaldii]|nr:armadillo-type protein [Gorgonomyces haynaldii]
MLRQLLEAVASPVAGTDLNQVSKQLAELYKTSGAIPELLNIATQDQNMAMRQLSAVECRKIIYKDNGSAWEHLDLQTREQIKQSILQMAVNESSPLVRHSLCHVIAEIAKVELEHQRWQELVSLLIQFGTNPEMAYRQVGVYVLYTLLDTIADYLESHLQPLVQLFTQTINDPQSLEVSVVTVQGLGKLADFIDQDDKVGVSNYQSLIPHIVNVLQRCLASGDDASVLKILEVFDGLLVLEAPVLSKHFADLVHLFLGIASNKDNSDDVRSQSLSFLMWTTAMHKSKLNKLGLVGQIIGAMFPIGSEDFDDGDDNPSTVAIQVISTMATTYPPQQVFPQVIKNVVEYSQSQIPGHRKASMLAIGVLADGTADHMRPQIKYVVDLVLKALQDPEPIVRKAGCMALGALSDALQDDVAQFHAIILPVLFALVEDQSMPVVKEALTSLDVFLEVMSDDIVPYMDGVMLKLVALLDQAPRPIQVLATNCIGSVAHAGGSDFVPYFAEVVKRLHALMSVTDDLEIRGVATDAMGAVAVAVGKEHFAPYLTTVMELAVQGMQQDKTRLNKCAYVLFGLLASQFGTDFSPFLPVIVPELLQSCAAPEKEFSTENWNEDQENEDFKVNSGIANEKECSIEAIGELFQATKQAFLPHVQEALNCGLTLVDHHQEGVRTAAVRCLTKFFITCYQMAHGTQEWVPGQQIQLHENVVAIGTLVMGGIVAMIGDEENRTVLYQVLQEVADLVKTIGPAALTPNLEGVTAMDALSNQLVLLLKGEHACQQEGLDDTQDGDEDEIAELDSLVISSAADLVAAIASALGPQFATYFQHFYPLIKRFYKKQRSLSDRSMAIGSLAEIAEGLDTGVVAFSQELLTLFLKGMQDEEDEVKSNAAYGAGIVCSLDPKTVPQYMAILQLLRPLFDKDDTTNAVDNACGAAARMILAAPDSVPLEHVLPVLVSKLPLTKDYNENRPVFKMLLSLLHAGNPILLQQLDRLMNIFGQVLTSENQLDPETRQHLVNYLKSQQQEHPQQFQTVLGQLAPSSVDAIRQYL